MYWLDIQELISNFFYTYSGVIEWFLHQARNMSDIQGTRHRSIYTIIVE